MDLPLLLCCFPMAWAILMVPLARTRAGHVLGAAGALAALALTARIVATVVATGPITGLGGRLRVDSLSAGALAITNFVFALSCLYAGPYLDRESAGGHIPARWARHYWSLIHVFFGAMVWTCLADSLGMVWVSMELTTLVTVPLVCLSGDKRGLEAAWKYFILCSVGIAFALVGTVLLYASTLKIAAAGGHSLSWSVIVAHASRLDPVLVRLAFLFALVGYGCKMGLAPLHNWLPDAHSEAPTPVSALLSGVLLNCAGYAVIRFTSVATRCLGADAVSPTLVALGLASVMVAAFFVVVQKDLKRLLAYSSVEHMGIIVIGLALGPAGIYAALFHALNHSVAKALLFLGAGQVVLGYRTQQMVRIHGLVDTARPTALALGAGGLAIVGLPPFAPFLSELLLLRAAFMGGHPVIGTLLLLALTLTFAGFLGHLVPMLCGARPPKVEPYEETRWAVPVSALLVLVSVCLCVSVPVGLDRFLASCVMTITGGQR